jgi:hypothetical protein
VQARKALVQGFASKRKQDILTEEQIGSVRVSSSATIAAIESNGAFHLNC